MKKSLENEVDETNFSKSKSRMKWLILILASTSLMGDYYCFDTPGAMHNLLLKRFGEITGENNFEYFYHMLYSVYSLPNILLPFIGGILIFKLGYRTMFLIFGFCVLSGQLIFSIGCSTKSIYLMIIGRVVFGIGGESLNTTQYAVITQWFAANELAFALGICISLARLGSALNDVVSPRIATTADVCSAVWLGFAICAFSFISTILLVYLDWRQDILIYMKEIVNSKASVTQNMQDEKSISEIRNLPRIFFLMVFLGMFMYGGILPFNYIATSFLIKTWFNNTTSDEVLHHAGKAMALPFAISALLVPFLGLLVDKFGKRGYLMIASAVIGIITYIIFILFNPIFALVTLGLTYSIFVSVFWPSISLVVPQDYIGIALGFATSLQNFCLVFFPMIVAYIYKTTLSYDITLLFFVFLLICSSVLSILIHNENIKHNNTLNIVQTQEEILSDEKICGKHTCYKKLSSEVEEDQEKLKANLNEDEIRLSLNLKNLF